MGPTRTALPVSTLVTQGWNGALAPGGGRAGQNNEHVGGAACPALAT